MDSDKISELKRENEELRNDLRKLHPMARQLHQLQLEEDATAGTEDDVGRISEYLRCFLTKKGTLGWSLKKETPTITAINKTTEAVNKMSEAIKSLTTELSKILPKQPSGNPLFKQR